MNKKVIISFFMLCLMLIVMTACSDKEKEISYDDIADINGSQCSAIFTENEETISIPE